jgi:hypothetical protein
MWLGHGGNRGIFDPVRPTYMRKRAGLGDVRSTSRNFDRAYIIYRTLALKLCYFVVNFNLAVARDV